jgi:integrase
MSRPKTKTPTYSLALRGQTYAVQWWDSEAGRSRRVSSGTRDEAEARQFLADFIASQSAPLQPEAVTVGSILAGYEQARLPKVQGKETLKLVVAALTRHLGPLSVEHLSASAISTYQDNRRREGLRGANKAHRKARVLSDGTLLRELGALRAALTWATRQSPPWIDHAPHIEMPSSPPPRHRWLTVAEAERLLAGAELNHIKLFIALGLFTAARASAILGLTWDRVDLAARTIDLGAGHGHKRRQRNLPINALLLPLLTEAKEATTNRYVVEYRSGPLVSIKSGFRAACRRAGLKDVTPHVLRHTSVTHMIQRGVSFQVVAAYAAMSVRMVEERYGHHSPDYLREASDALTSTFSRPSGRENELATI